VNLAALDTIRGRLIAGFLALMALLAAAGIVGGVAIGAASGEIASALGTVRRETALTATLTTNVTRELAAAARYVEGAASSDRDTFRAAGWAAHGALRDLNDSPGLTAAEVGLIATIDERLSTLEVGLTQAMLLRDLGRAAETVARADTVQGLEAGLTADVNRPPTSARRSSMRRRVRCGSHRSAVSGSSSPSSPGRSSSGSRPSCTRCARSRGRSPGWSDMRTP
jgi:hypothetical protein